MALQCTECGNTERFIRYFLDGTLIDGEGRSIESVSYEESDIHNDMCVKCRSTEIENIREVTNGN